MIRRLLVVVSLLLVLGYPLASEAVAIELEVEATAYTPHDPGLTGVTATGTRATPYRTIAVDPKVIPLGSIVYVKGFKDPFLAEDTGGAIKGHKVDICLATRPEAFKWGRRKVKLVVYTPYD